MTQRYKLLFPNEKLNILISYGIHDKKYINMKPEEHGNINSIVCDSGVFSKNPKPLDDFIGFCKPLLNQFGFFINYDEDFTINGFQKNYSNLKHNEENGIDVVPVVHDYESEIVDEIAIYLKEKYPIIALGAFKDKNNKDRKNKQNITRAVNRIVDGGAKVHLLGVTDYHILKDIPVHFCDSTSWTKQQEHGRILWFNTHCNAHNTIYIPDKIKYLPKNKKQYIGNYKYYNFFEAYLDSLGLQITDLLGYGRTSYRKLLNMHYFVKLQEILREEHKQKGFKMD